MLGPSEVFKTRTSCVLSIGLKMYLKGTFYYTLLSSSTIIFNYRLGAEW